MRTVDRVTCQRGNRADESDTLNKDLFGVIEYLGKKKLRVSTRLKWIVFAVLFVGQTSLSS